MSFEFYLPNLFTLIFGQGGSLGKISHLTKSRIELSVFWYNSSLSDSRLPVQRFWHECLFVLHNWFWLAYGSCQIILLNRILTLVDFSFWRHFEEKPDFRIWEFFNMKGLCTIDTELNFPGYQRNIRPFLKSFFIVFQSDSFHYCLWFSLFFSWFLFAIPSHQREGLTHILLPYRCHLGRVNFMKILFNVFVRNQKQKKC